MRATPSRWPPRWLPILAFFFVFQIAFLRLRRKQILKILVGVLYTFAGLTLFLTGVNVGFMPAGSYLGSRDGRAVLQLDA